MKEIVTTKLETIHVSDTDSQKIIVINTKKTMVGIIIYTSVKNLYYIRWADDSFTHSDTLEELVKRYSSCKFYQL